MVTMEVDDLLDRYKAIIDQQDIQIRAQTAYERRLHAVVAHLKEAVGIAQGAIVAAVQMLDEGNDLQNSVINSLDTADDRILQCVRDADDHLLPFARSEDSNNGT